MIDFYLDLNAASVPPDVDTYVFGFHVEVVQLFEWIVYPLLVFVWVVPRLDNVREQPGRQFVLDFIPTGHVAVRPLIPYVSTGRTFHEQRPVLVIVSLDVGVGRPYALMDVDLLALLVVDFDAVLDVVNHVLHCSGVRWLAAFLAQVGEDVRGEVGRQVVVSGHVFGLFAVVCWDYALYITRKSISILFCYALKMHPHVSRFNVN